MKIFKTLDPEMIMTLVISLILVGVGVFTFLTVTTTTKNTLPDYQIQNVAGTKDFQSDTLLAEPVTDSTFTYYAKGFGAGYYPGVNCTGTDYFFNVQNPYGSYANQSWFNSSVYVNRLIFKFTQGSSNFETSINLTDENNALYGTIRINKTYINVTLAPGYINLTDGLLDEITATLWLELGDDNATRTARITLYNDTAGLLGDTGIQTTTSTGKPLKLVLTAGTKPNAYSNISIDDMTGYVWTWPTHLMLDVEPIGNSVFNIIGIVLIIGAILAIVGLVYNARKENY